MNPQLLFVIGLLVACIGMFVTNKPRMDVVALLVIVILPNDTESTHSPARKGGIGKT